MAAEGLLIFDKPMGPTSFACVSLARRALGVERIGHCGTLDPLAQGILLLLLGTATKRQNDFLSLDKEYRFRARWGIQTDTADIQGKTLAECPPPIVAPESLQAVMTSFVGETMQMPPKVSALKYKGKPRYVWARRGIEVPRFARPVRIDRFELIASDSLTWEARVVCSRGTYIRALIEDVAGRFGALAVMESLVRERVGPHTLAQALSWESLRSIPRLELETHVHPIGADTRIV